MFFHVATVCLPGRRHHGLRRHHQRQRAPSGNVTPGVSVRASANAFTSGGSGGVVSTPGSEARDDFTISRSVRGELRAIRNSSITLRDAKGRETTLVFNRETRFRAEDKSAFGGRSRLTATGGIQFAVAGQNTPTGTFVTVGISRLF